MRTKVLRALVYATVTSVVLPVSVGLFMWSNSGMEYKEYVYVDGKEIERPDLYLIAQVVFNASIPTLILLCATAAIGLVWRRDWITPKL